MGILNFILIVIMVYINICNVLYTRLLGKTSFKTYDDNFFERQIPLKVRYITPLLFLCKDWFSDYREERFILSVNKSAKKHFYEGIRDESIQVKRYEYYKLNFRALQIRRLTRKDNKLYSFLYKLEKKGIF